MKISSIDADRSVQEQIMKDIKTNKINLKKGLYIIATPIGNLDDINKRAILTLQEADIIICENPKHSLKLLNKLGIKKKLISLHDYNEEKVINKISKLQNKSRMVLISDAGSPLISDPGYKLVKHFINMNSYITCVPGSSAVINALQLSGLPINNFVFYGFIPKQKLKRKNFFTKMKDVGFTSVCFVSSKNLKNTISDIVEFMGDREISLCKEMTKLHESIFRGKTNKILSLLNENKISLRGEFTIVISGESKKNPKKINNSIKNEITKLLKKYNLTEVVKIVHSLTDISKKDIYQMAIKIKDD